MSGGLRCNTVHEVLNSFSLDNANGPLVQRLGATNKRNGLDILRESRMNHKERSHLIKQVIDAAKSHAKCKNLHHKKAHQHAFGWVCPAEAELEAAIYRVELMLQKGERDELR